MNRGRGKLYSSYLNKTGDGRRNGRLSSSLNIGARNSRQAHLKLEHSNVEKIGVIVAPSSLGQSKERKVGESQIASDLKQISNSNSNTEKVAADEQTVNISTTCARSDYTVIYSINLPNSTLTEASLSDLDTFLNNKDDTYDIEQTVKNLSNTDFLLKEYEIYNSNKNDLMPFNPKQTENSGDGLDNTHNISCNQQHDAITKNEGDVIAPLTISDTNFNVKDATTTISNNISTVPEPSVSPSDHLQVDDTDGSHTNTIECIQNTSTYCTNSTIDVQHAPSRILSPEFHEPEPVAKSYLSYGGSKFGLSPDPIILVSPSIPAPPLNPWYLSQGTTECTYCNYKIYISFVFIDMLFFCNFYVIINNNIFPPY